MSPNTVGATVFFMCLAVQSRSIAMLHAHIWTFFCYFRRQSALSVYPGVLSKPLTAQRLVIQKGLSL